MNREKLYYSFLKRLVKFGKIDWEDYHRQYGNFCNYPKCCIDNFIYLYVFNDIPPSEYMNKRYGQDFGINYVRCKNCRIK